MHENTTDARRCSASFALVAVLALCLQCAAASDVTPAEGEVNVNVFFATNRAENDTDSPDRFGGGRGTPRYGQCRVEFSPIPLINQFGDKVPFYVPTETNTISITEWSDRELFWDELIAASRRTTQRSVAVFTHGYNYGFNRTCRMAAEMQRALRGHATVLMVSWPSNGLASDYLPDQVDVEWSVPFLADVFVETANRVGPSNLQVLAHSMGTRGVVYALQQLRAESRTRPLIDQLVLLAPDFDSATFLDLLPGIRPLMRHITLYASSNDTPLKASRQVNGHPRLGEAGDFLTVTQGIETIDVSPVGRYQILGHEYFFFNPRVVDDLLLLVGNRTPAAQRSTLNARQRDSITYWQIAKPPETADASN